jgi:hypothetical protein
MSLLKDDRENYKIGGLAAKELTALTSRLINKYQAKMAKGPIDAIDNTKYFDYNDAARMLEDGDITIAKANQLLKQAGYPEKDVQEFTRGYTGLVAKSARKESNLEKEMRPMTEREKEEALDNLMDEFSEGGEVKKKYPNEGLEALAKEAPEVVKRMGYKDGKSVVDSLNSNPRVILNGLNAAIDSKMLDLQDAQNNNDAVKIEKIGQEINELDKQRIIIQNSMSNVRMAEGGNVDNQMSMLMDNEKDMLPDEEMEDNYMDFILDEALTEEEEDMLMSKLEQDEQLSMLFDKVVEVASEFAGSGPVEGPGTGVSDSIPARLSDGEFVFTAKAVEEIGADNLMAMMKDAEMKADERQGMANGGEMDEETVVVKGDDEPARQEIRVVKETVDSAGRMVEDEDEISKNIKSNMMLDPNQQHVRS